MHTVGLTGGIASGKSSVAAHLESRGVPVLDADEVYHRLLREDPGLLRELRDRFGDEVFTPDGTLDRARLGSIVFADPAARADLGRIAHPRVRSRIAAWLAERRDEDPPVAVVVIPLLYEGGLETMFDDVWVVAIDPATQLRRLMERNGLDEAQARARIGSQMPLAEKIARADAVIDNQGTPDATRNRVDRLLSRWDLPPASGAPPASPPAGPV